MPFLQAIGDPEKEIHGGIAREPPEERKTSVKITFQDAGKALLEFSCRFLSGDNPQSASIGNIIGTTDTGVIDGEDPPLGDEGPPEFNIFLIARNGIM